MLCLQDDSAEAGPRGDAYLRGHDLFPLCLRGHFLIGIDTCLGFRLTCLLAGTDPFQFLRKRAFAPGFFARLLLHPFGLLFDPAGVVALERHAAATVEFENPTGDVIQKVTVVSDENDAPGKIDQIILQPGDGLGVEMVGRFIHQDHVWL